MNSNDLIYLGYLRMVMAFNIFNRNSDYNSLSNIFIRTRYHKTFDYIINIVRARVKKMKKPTTELSKLQLITLLNVDISSLLKLPKSEILYRDEIVKTFYNGKEIEFNKVQKRCVSMATEYFNNVNNFK